MPHGVHQAAGGGFAPDPVQSTLGVEGQIVAVGLRGTVVIEVGAEQLTGLEGFQSANSALRPPLTPHADRRADSTSGSFDSGTHFLSPMLLTYDLQTDPVNQPARVSGIHPLRLRKIGGIFREIERYRPHSTMECSNCTGGARP
jgi:hypothetical protein